MSTAQATERKRGFREASAARKPTLVCTGYVAGVPESKESASGKYNVTTVEINGLGASPNARVYLLTRPEWFETNEDGFPAFRPDSLEKVEGGRSMLFVYQKNIAQVGNTSVIQGLAGNEERFDTLAEALLSDPKTSDESDSAEAIQNIIEKLLVAKEGQTPFEIGYILKQQRNKTDDVDEDGKPIYVLENRYEVSEWFEATEANKKKYRKSAEKSRAKSDEAGEAVRFKVTFDEGTPF